MNGRVYDNSIGKMLSADIYVQAPYNTQSYNRYSYTMNNPLKYTDPTGYEWDDPDCLACEDVGYTGGYDSWDDKMETEGVGSSWDSDGDGYSDYSPEYRHTEGSDYLEFTGNIRHTESSAADSKYVNHHNTIINGITIHKSALHYFVGGSNAINNKLADNIANIVLSGTIHQRRQGSFINGAGTASFIQMFNNAGKKIIDNTYDAALHYYSNGAIVELGPNTKRALREHPKVRHQADVLRNGTAKFTNSNIEVKMRSRVFHLGKTGVVFTTDCTSSSCTTVYTGFVEAHIKQQPIITGVDGFRDPFYIGVELPGGTPYDYTPYTWRETYPNNFR